MDNLELRQTPSDAYTHRTRINARYSDITLAFAVNFNTYGEIATEKAANGRIFQIDLTKEENTPVVVAREVYKILRLNNYHRINIAGNGLYSLGPYEWDQLRINQYIYDVLKPVTQHLTISQVRSGGQTGADLAGIVAAVALGLNVIATFPKGFRQKLGSGDEVISSEEEIRDTIIRYIDQLEK